MKTINPKLEDYVDNTVESPTNFKEENQKMNTVKNETFDIAKKLISTRNIGNNRFGLDDSKVNTNLISKNYSPMIIRKYQLNGWPLFVGIICDWSLEDLDDVVNSVKKACAETGMITNNIQSLRNFTGILSETIEKFYNSKKEGVVEGIAITLESDKSVIENFYGDPMTHLACRLEYLLLLNIAPHV